MNVGRREKERDIDTWIKEKKETSKREAKGCVAPRPMSYLRVSLHLHLPSIGEKARPVPRPVHNAPYLIDNLCASSCALLWRCAFIWGVSRGGFFRRRNESRCTRSNESVERYSKQWKIQNSMINISNQKRFFFFYLFYTYFNRLSD